jgi:hypothetical protein
MQWNMRRLVYHWSTPFWRRTLEQWSDLIAHAGFAISRMYEPRPSEDDVARQPELSDARTCLFSDFRSARRVARQPACGRHVAAQQWSLAVSSLWQTIQAARSLAFVHNRLAR